MGDAREIIADDSRVVPARNPNELALAIEKLINEILSAQNSGVMTDWKNSLRESIKGRFSVAEMTAGYSKIWHKIKDQNLCVE